MYINISYLHNFYNSTSPSKCTYIASSWASYDNLRPIWNPIILWILPGETKLHKMPISTENFYTLCL